MAARRGDGLDRSVVLGGGGLYFVAWQVGYLHTVQQAGIDIRGAQRIVGTSAGSVVATVLSHGRLGWLNTQVGALGRFPALLGAMAPATGLRPSQERALAEFGAAGDARPETIQSIGRAALAAVTQDPSRVRGSLGLIITARSWPSAALHVTCVDAYTGERCVVDTSSGVRPVAAAAASSAVPGLFPPQPVGDRRCMDGGVSGTGLHLDLVAGARRAIVLALSDGANVTEPRMTVHPGSIEAELSAVSGTGTRVFLRTPGVVDIATLMSPTAVPGAHAAGAAQATADLPELREFWT
jgi:NTE family protein